VFFLVYAVYLVTVPDSVLDSREEGDVKMVALTWLLTIPPFMVWNLWEYFTKVPLSQSIKFYKKKQAITRELKKRLDKI
jgi:hypothetical protein